MKYVISDTLFDTLKLIPFLFIAFLVIELIEHKYSKKTIDFISKNKKYGPIAGGVMGAIPQCGMSVLATNFYLTRIISLGTLIAIYLSTSDEMIPIMISHKMPLLNMFIIILIKVVIGIFAGLLIDKYIKQTNKKNFHICEEDDCDCDESVVKSSMIHTLKISGYIFLITLFINILFYYIDNTIIENILHGSSIFAPLLASVIGLIPNCGSSVVITEFYFNNIISFGTMMSGLLTGSGVALFVLYKTSKDKKEKILIFSLIYLIGCIVGIIFNLLGV